MKTGTVLISGAGIAGPTLAFWLKAAGFEPTLIEHAPELRTGGYVIDFWGLGYDIAERMGLLPKIDRVGYRIREMRIVNGSGERISGFGTRTLNDLTGGRFVTLARSDLSRLLFETIKDRIEAIFGDDIIGMEDDGESVEVQFRWSRARRFDLVIGADGLHSKVRGLSFGAQDRFEVQLGYLVAAFEVQGYSPRDEQIYIIFNEPGRLLGRFALHEDRTLFLFVFTAGEDSAPLDLPGQKALLRARYGDGRWECSRILDELDHVQDFYFDRVSQIRMNAWSKGRVALVGDAAFCVSLMAGQGAALGMTAAYVLAGELAKAGRQDEAFANYEALLRGFIASKQSGAARFSAAFAPKTRSGLFLRNQVIKASAIPGVARFAFAREITDTLRLPQYSWAVAFA
jgi:2-polyprenyl-6-methoxyphenol hydroxylase-like FAD-dependent oxidoreductase